MELFSILLPILIDFINRKFANSSDTRLLVSVLVCSAFGLFFNWLDTSFAFGTPRLAFESVSNSILVVFGLAQLSFKAVWEKTETHKDLKYDNI